jgi:hypothetical protein
LRYQKHEGSQRGDDGVEFATLEDPGCSAAEDIAQ